ncbi:TetR/AcrR family transcriptional regulator [Flavisphingomonas formosensis]|uniref:TetR/AcrR family transcriptional regulator n=1 Tax=Flavisphingomonas formosensis TaxID=861534 RepID=UPI0012F91EB3|nr:TetR/AcrR family transcriptional regulator [Sphingomonas formosensis]
MKTARRDDRGAAARDAIIDAAEALFGEYGIDRVSLRQISTAAGGANNFAVQYHFGDRETLIRAVFEKRLPEIERMREAMFAKAEAEQRLGDPRMVAEILFRPSVEIRNGAGKRSYAAFLLSLSFSQDGLNGRFGTVSNLAPLAARAAALMAKAAPQVSPDLIAQRLALAPALFIGSLFHLLRNAPHVPDDLLIGDTLDMVTAAITAAPAPALAEAIAAAGAQ